MAILTGTHESPMYRDNSDEATALHQIIAARRLLLHAAGPCHRGDGSAAEHPLSYTWSPPPAAARCSSSSSSSAAMATWARASSRPPRPPRSATTATASVDGMSRPAPLPQTPRPRIFSR